MRSTQEFGLTKEACMFLNENCAMIPNQTCPHCGEVISTQLDRKIYDSAKDYGMFDDGPDLYEYTLKDGSKVKEIVQAVPWSSGPCIFLCLEKENNVTDKTRIGAWSQEAIDQA